MENYPGNTPETSSDDDDDESSSQGDSNESTSSGKESENQDPDEQVSEKEESNDNEWNLFGDEKETDDNVPEDELADDEKKLIADDYVEGRHEEVRDELLATPQESPEEAEVLANAALLETINAKLNEGEVPTEATLNNAVAETAKDLGIDISAEPTETRANVDDGSEEKLPPHESDSANINPDAEAEDPNEKPGNNNVTPNNTPVPAPIPNSPNSQLNVSNPNTLNNVVPAPNPNANPITNPNVNAGSNNLPPPPPPPNRRRRGGGGWYPPPGPNINNLNLGNPNFGNTQVSPNTYTVPANNSGNRRKNAQYFLVGGLLGYMVGRRRGRIKTEEKLLPIQQKLTEQINDLQQNIARREEQIRKLVRAQIAVEPATAAKIVNRLERRADHGKSKVVEQTKSKILHETGNHNDHENRAATPTSVIEISKRKEAGRFAIATEKTPEAIYSEEALRDSVEISTKANVILKIPERPKTVEAMAIAELLVITQKIPVEGSNLRKLYEANRLNDEGLRRVARAFLRGERYEKVIKDNLLSNESFKLDKNYEQLQTKPLGSNGNGSTIPQTAGSHQINSDNMSINHLGGNTNTQPTDSLETKIKAKNILVGKTKPIAAVFTIAILLLFLLLRQS